MPCNTPNYRKMNKQTNPKDQPVTSSNVIRKVIGKNPVNLKKGRVL